MKNNRFFDKAFFLLPVIFIYFLAVNLFFKIFFIGSHWPFLVQEGVGSIIRALAFGILFDMSIVGYFFIPALFIFYAMLMTGSRMMKGIFRGYFVVMVFFFLIFWFADIQYFEEAGKHFTYEAFAYIGSELPTIVFGAFKLQPLLSIFSVLCTILFAYITWFLTGKWLKTFISIEKERSSYYYISTFIVLFVLVIVAARGGPQNPKLKMGDSCISSSIYINGISLNPIYSVLMTTLLSSKQFEFSTEEKNLQEVKDLLDISQLPSMDKEYPLLRLSTGSEQGNRKNIVIIILESWSGNQVGALGSNKNLTPFFDGLSENGLLFTNFFASGIRTSEGIFSILCSFPNQPFTPIMDRTLVYQTQWRPLSQILKEAGYQTMFVHGASLNFDNLKKFLKYSGFNKIIDKRNLAPSVPFNSSLGYHDEDVMRKADELFNDQNGNPFLGVIYTINTHPPFPIPEGFPETYPPTTKTNKFLNSLKYADHALEVFFDLAKTKPYFKDTIFLFVSDHARTTDDNNLFDQHHIPMLIYSPGYIKPAVNPVVGSQLDVLPTVLGLLKLKTTHASWGRDLLDVPKDDGFAASVSGNEVRWHDNTYLLNDSLTGIPMLFDVHNDNSCRENIWLQQKKEGERLKLRTRSFISLSQTLMYENRIYPMSFNKH